MKHTDLRQWCDAKRGRLSLLARELGQHRQFIWQMAEGARPIPASLLPLMVHEMRRTERLEQQASQSVEQAAA